MLNIAKTLGIIGVALVALLGYLGTYIFAWSAVLYLCLLLTFAIMIVLLYVAAGRIDPDEDDDSETPAAA